MRLLLILFWAAAIFVLTCTASFSELMESGIIRFQWNGNPQLTEFFSPMPNQLHEDFLRQKIGHIGSFGVLTILLLSKYRSQKWILLITLFYSGLTEFLQLFFTRDGRLFDIGFDLIGILLGLGAGSHLPSRKSKNPDIKIVK